MQAERIDKEDKSETFGIFKHPRIDRESEVSGQDADEEDEGHAERDAAEPHFAQGHARRADQGDDYDGLQRRLLREKGVEPRHVFPY